jgi:hypothetical protein
MADPAFVVGVGCGFPLATEFVFCCWESFSTRFLLESLILAQDERWRRA